MDNCFYEAFNANVLYTRHKNRRVHCYKCGFPLEVHCCDDDLYVVKCKCCNIVSMLKATCGMDALCRIGWYNEDDAKADSP